MRETRKVSQQDTFDRPVMNDDRVRKNPDPTDPNEETGMPQKEMPSKNEPITSNPHDEEILDYIPK